MTEQIHLHHIDAEGTVHDGPVFKARYLDSLIEQLEFLDASCEAYDNGARAESKRLAATVRILVHDTGSSTSLLTHLVGKDKMRWADGIVPEILADLIQHQEKGQAMAISLLTTIKMGAGFLENFDLVKYVPTFEIQPLGERWAPFEYWWTTPRLSDLDDFSMSRKQIVLWIANKDGGAHIDELPAAYANVSQNGSMGTRLSNLAGKTKADDSPLPAAMRQIAEEVRYSIRHELNGILAIQRME